MTDKIMEEIIRNNRKALGLTEDAVVLDSFTTVNRLTNLGIVEECSKRYNCGYILADGLIVGYEQVTD